MPKEKKYYPVVKDWVDAGNALDKFGGFRKKKGGRIYKALTPRTFKRSKRKRKR